MKILFHRPEWSNRWIPYVKKALEDIGTVRETSTMDGGELGRLSESADLLFSGWANEAVVFWSNYFQHKKIVTYLRRYELFTPQIMDSIKWDAVDHTVFVSDHWARVFEEKTGLRLSYSVIPNGVDVSDFQVKEFTGDKKIAMVCQLRGVKNLPLAAQILLHLPVEYTIHHIGLPAGNELDTFYPYLESLGLEDRFLFNGTIPSEKVKDWLSDKDYILSTSLVEGCPNNIIEAMAMGITPVVHEWPGASEQFPNTFAKAEAGARLIASGVHKPEEYRNRVVKNFSTDNFRKLTRVVRGAYNT